MKINVGGKYLVDRRGLNPFFNQNKDLREEGDLVYLGKFFLYKKNNVIEEIFENSYLFYSIKNKQIWFTNNREDFALEEEYDSNLKFVNFKENKSFINDSSISCFKNNNTFDCLCSVWFDEDDFLSNKNIIDKEFYSIK